MSPLKFNIQHIATHSARFVYSLQHGLEEAYVLSHCRCRLPVEGERNVSTLR